MSRRPAKVTQADVARAIRAARQAGAADVIIAPDGTIRIAIAMPELAKPPLLTEDDRLDRELAEFESAHGD